MVVGIADTGVERDLVGLGDSGAATTATADSDVVTVAAARSEHGREQRQTQDDDVWHMFRFDRENK